MGLAMDAFAVALAIGASRHSQGLRPAFRISFHFGLFQFLMPVVGWFIGMTVAHWVQSFDHWIAFSLLAYVGGRMVRAGFNPEAETYPSDPTRKWTLLLLCIATSIDALAVGLSLAMLRINIWYPSVIIGVVTAAISWMGMSLGKRLGSRFGKRMEVAGGVILILIGLRVLYVHSG
jgi:putative Mn2+ efflux pump MntP